MSVGLGSDDDGVCDSAADRQPFVSGFVFEPAPRTQGSQPASFPSPPDAISVAQSVGMAIAATLCAASFALWHARRGQPRGWLFMLLIFVVSACWAYVRRHRENLELPTWQTHTQSCGWISRPHAGLKSPKSGAGGDPLDFGLCPGLDVWALRQCADLFGRVQSLECQAQSSRGRYAHLWL